MSDTATMYRNMDVKTINIKIKYGATMEELLEYFNCSEEQFEGYVKRNFGEKGKRDIYANLEKNKKKREKKKKGLRAGVNNAKQQIKFRLNDEKQYMLELKKIIAEHQTTIEGIIKEISEVSKKHAQVKAEIVSNSEELERVRKDIDTLKKVDILFYKNGMFELENFNTNDIPEIQLDQDTFNLLCEDETAEELSIKAIKQIVRLEQILQWFSTNQLSYEITFEAEEMQKVFEKIHKI